MSYARARRPSFFQSVGEDVTPEKTIFDLIAQEDKTQFQTFLIGKPDLDVKNNDGLTALHVAVRENYPVVSQLIEAKANIEAKTPGGDTALLLAADCFCYLQTVFQQLLAAGANPFAENFAARTLYYFALRNHEPDLFKYVIDLKIPHKLPNQDGDTALHVLAAGDATELSELKEFAIQARKKFIAERMREAEANDFFVTNQFGETPLHLAAGAHNDLALSVMFEVIQEKLSHEQIQKLLVMQTLQGDTVLHYAVRNLRCHTVLELLAPICLQYEINPDIENGAEKIPFVELVESATLNSLMQQEKLKAVELLQKAGADKVEPLRLACVYNLIGFVVVLRGGSVEEARVKLQAAITAGSPVTPSFAATLPVLPMGSLDQMLLDFEQNTPRGKQLRNECCDENRKYIRVSHAPIQPVVQSPRLEATSPSVPSVIHSPLSLMRSPRSPLRVLSVVQSRLVVSDAEDTCCGFLKSACVIL